MIDYYCDDVVDGYVGGGVCVDVFVIVDDGDGVVYVFDFIEFV